MCTSPRKQEDSSPVRKNAFWCNLSSAPHPLPPQEPAAKLALICTDRRFSEMPEGRSGKSDSTKPKAGTGAEGDLRVNAQ